DALALALAAWIGLLGGRGERGRHWRIDDPLSEVLLQRMSAAPDPQDARVDAVIGFEPLFGDLADSAVLRERVRSWHRRLLARGARRADSLPCPVPAARRARCGGADRRGRRHAGDSAGLPAIDRRCVLGCPRQRRGRRRRFPRAVRRGRRAGALYGAALLLR